MQRNHLTRSLFVLNLLLHHHVAIARGLTQTNTIFWCILFVGGLRLLLLILTCFTTLAICLPGRPCLVQVFTFMVLFSGPFSGSVGRLVLRQTLHLLLAVLLGPVTTLRTAPGAHTHLIMEMWALHFSCLRCCHRSEPLWRHLFHIQFEPFCTGSSSITRSDLVGTSLKLSKAERMMSWPPLTRQTAASSSRTRALVLGTHRRASCFYFESLVRSVSVAGVRRCLTAGSCCSG